MMYCYANSGYSIAWVVDSMVWILKQLVGNGCGTVRGMAPRRYGLSGRLAGQMEELGVAQGNCRKKHRFVAMDGNY